KPEHVFRAIDAAAHEFQLGAVGAGRGMTCYGLKGGIGSASRVFEADGQVYTLGALVLTNFGALPDLVICGDPVGKKLTGDNAAEPKGSCIMVIATDAPVSTRSCSALPAGRRAAWPARAGSPVGAAAKWSSPSLPQTA
ncbi:MAG: P1 family peptidase, partial [Clostridia bacterium]|nr:P1 family peptidase [Clostridia bacterium]